MPAKCIYQKEVQLPISHYTEVQRIPNYREQIMPTSISLAFKVYLRERIKGLLPALSRVVDGVVQAPGTVRIFPDPGMIKMELEIN